MDRDRTEALKAFLAAFDKRLEAAPVLDRRRAHLGGGPVDGRRTQGPVDEAFAYWDSKPDPKE